MADIGREIAEANRPLDPGEVAAIIFKNLFERGPNRLNSENKFIAIGTIGAALIEWRKQLDTARAEETSTYKRMYNEAKTELDTVKLKLAILQKEQ